MRVYSSIYVLLSFGLASAESPAFADFANAPAILKARVSTSSGRLNIRRETDFGVPDVREPTGKLTKGTTIQVDPAFIEDLLASASPAQRERFLSDKCSLSGDGLKELLKEGFVRGVPYEYLRVNYVENGNTIGTGLVAHRYLDFETQGSCEELRLVANVQKTQQTGSCRDDGTDGNAREAQVAGLIQDTASVLARASNDALPAVISRPAPAPVRKLSGASSGGANSCGRKISSSRSRAAESRVRPGLERELAEKGFYYGAPMFIRAIKYGSLNAGATAASGRGAPLGASVDPVADQAFQSRFNQGLTDPISFISNSREGVWDFASRYNTNSSLTEDRGGRVEVWMQNADGTYGLFKTYEVCTFSGLPGFKRHAGDFQSPEGFYKTCNTGRDLNPASEKYHLSFRYDYPNDFDQRSRRQGSSAGDEIRIHGKCKSVGCFAVEDGQVEEIFSLLNASLNSNEVRTLSGARGDYCVPIHVFPFEMTEENLNRFSPDALNRLSNHLNRNVSGKLSVEDFWRNLKEGYDYFEQYRRLPDIGVSGSGAQTTYEYDHSDDQIVPRSCAR